MYFIIIYVFHCNIFNIYFTPHILLPIFLNTNMLLPPTTTPLSLYIFLYKFYTWATFTAGSEIHTYTRSDFIWKSNRLSELCYKRIAHVLRRRRQKKICAFDWAERYVVWQLARKNSRIKPRWRANQASIMLTMPLPCERKASSIPLTHAGGAGSMPRRTRAKNNTPYRRRQVAAARSLWSVFVIALLFRRNT